ncbi:MAG: synthase delta chain [Thermoleophilia bacterium]|nr:synthase delta chain [Thermoleophilia bacterium]
MSRTDRTYANALLEAVPADDAVRVADELDQVGALRAEAPAEWAALTAPGLAAAVRKGTIDRLLADSHPLVRNVLKVLVDHGRLDEAPEVAASFRALVADRERQLDVHVTSAVELSSELRAKLEERLSSSTGKAVRLHASVDPDIIGGLVVRHGDTLVDTSLRGRLEGLRLALSRPAPRTATPTSSSDDS